MQRANPDDANIKIIGTGISGLLTAYYLLKLRSKHESPIKIDIFDCNDAFAGNATTHSLAWLNVVYPSKDTSERVREDYDRFRFDSLQHWEQLLKNLQKDGIINVCSTDQEAVIVDEHAINSLFIFFSQKQESDFLYRNIKLGAHSDNYRAESIPKNKVVNHFPFLEKLPGNIRLRNIASEKLINPKILRMQLIEFLKNSGINFHWNKLITPEIIQSEPHTQWILTAGNGCIPLLKNTQFETLNFKNESHADIIRCTLNTPLDLKGKVFHFAESENGPSFHLRNDEMNPSMLIIIISRQAGKSLNLNQYAQIIFNFLKLDVNEYHCDTKIERPMTLDGRPIVALRLGINKNITFAYGHSLFTNAEIFDDVANNVACQINQKHQRLIFASVGNHAKLEPFSASTRFALSSSVNANNYPLKNNASLLFKTINTNPLQFEEKPTVFKQAKL